MPDKDHIGNYPEFFLCWDGTKSAVDALVLHWVKFAPDQAFVLDLSTFWPQYNAWWDTPCREATLGLAILIFRVISCALFFSTGALSVKLNSERSLLRLAGRMYAAADKLAAGFLFPGLCIMQVEQLSLVAISFQSTGHQILAWEALSKALGLAKEIGITPNPST